ncbi:MAG: LysR family transcriptional regulator [Lawsonibacter sp.]|nr:LysR family transcriptional regulator [Lawsonibacter sp.]
MYMKNPEYFLTIIKEQSISKAAERLYLSQPYLSQYLAKLEANLGVQLLDRSHTPLKLTPAGDLFHAYLERQSFLDRQLTCDLRDLQDRKRPMLHIGVSTWRGSTLLPDILPLFTPQYPDVQVILHEAPVPELEELAADNVVDFCVMYIPNDQTELTYEQIMQEHVFLVGHRDHPLLQGLNSPWDAPVSFPDLRLLEHERVIMLPPDWRLSKLLKNTFSIYNVELQNVLITTNNTTAIHLAAENMGFAFLQESGISRTPYLDRLACFTVGEPPLTCPTAVVYKKNGFLSPAARTFIDLTRAFYRRFDR